MRLGVVTEAFGDRPLDVVLSWLSQAAPEITDLPVSAKYTIGRVPSMVIVGCGSIFTSLFIYWAYFHYAFFGLVGHKQNLVYWLVGAIAFGLLWYVGAKAVRRGQGVDIDKVYAEIPPE